MDSQINDYYKAFTKIYVVTNDDNLAKSISTVHNKKVGFITLSQNNSLVVQKKAEVDNSFLSHEVIFKILRKNEYEKIILDEFHELPQTTPVMYYRECLNLVKDINIIDFQRKAINVLRNRNIDFREEYLRFVPKELKFPFYFSNLRKKEYYKLNMFLQKKYGG